MARVPTYPTAHKKIGYSHRLSRRRIGLYLRVLPGFTARYRGMVCRTLETLSWTLGKPSGSDVDWVAQILHRTDPWWCGIRTASPPMRPGGSESGSDSVIRSDLPFSAIRGARLKVFGTLYV